MELYYTTSSGQDQVQSDPKLSLGGYKSSSLVSNNSFNNLFQEITQFLLSRDSEDEYIALILKNDDEESIENLWLWFEYIEEKYASLLVAAVDLVVDSNGVLQMERIFSKNSTPLYAEFHEADGIDNAVSLGTIESGGMIGLWFCRKLISGLSTSVCEDSNIYEINPSDIDLYQSVVLDKSESISIKFRYGVEYYGGPVGGDLV